MYLQGGGGDMQRKSSDSAFPFFFLYITAVSDCADLSVISHNLYNIDLLLERKNWSKRFHHHHLQRLGWWCNRCRTVSSNFKVSSIVVARLNLYVRHQSRMTLSYRVIQIIERKWLPCTLQINECTPEWSPPPHTHISVQTASTLN